MKYYNEGTKDMYEVKESSEGFELRYYHMQKNYKIYATNIDAVVHYFSELTDTDYMEMLRFFTQQIIDFKTKYNLSIDIFQGPKENLITSMKDINIKNPIDLCRQCIDKGNHCINIPGTNDAVECFSLFKNRQDTSVTMYICFERSLYRTLKGMRESTPRQATINRGY